MALKNELHNRIGIAKDICLVVGPGHLIFKAHGCRSGVFLAPGRRSVQPKYWKGRNKIQAADIPDTNTLI
jgi:hypothetical protein